MHGGERTLLISGPNTGGKTVMLKTTALAALHGAERHHPAGGSRHRACRCSPQVFTDIGDRQSLAESLSTFSGHLAVPAHHAGARRRGTLVLLDEVGSGTDPARAPRSRRPCCWS